MKFIIKLFLSLLPFFVSAQSYTSYFTGSSTDISPIPKGGVCLMGGATEDDEAMKWFLKNANGGDVLVLRTSGSDGYNDYLYSELGIPVNSVETIVCHSPLASFEPYVQQRIMNAEAIWFAGGDQWNYVSYWRNTPVDSLINEAILNREIVIGGTSAGMAILGGYYFSAENGTVTSATALANPYHERVTVDSTYFIENEHLATVITDTHYDDPDRKGRQVTFLARIFSDYGVQGKGIACDEYTAVCIDKSGWASVYGGYPTYDDNAYFIQTNCELPDNTPENCSPNTPLDWNLDEMALKVYAIKGTADGGNTFDLTDWKTGNGGVWQNWYVNNGTLHEVNADEIDCTTLSNGSFTISENLNIFPNPSHNIIKIETTAQPIETIIILNTAGNILYKKNGLNTKKTTVNIDNFPAGIYFIHIKTQVGRIWKKFVKESF